MKKYLTVQEAATSLSIALNRGVHPRDIADLAREKTVTPVVFFEGFIGELVMSDSDRCFSGESFSGYLHSSEMKHMIDCIVKNPLYRFVIYEFTEKRIISKYQKGDSAYACYKSYSLWKSPKSSSFSLFYSNNGFPFFSTSDIRIPSIEVESIIEKHRKAITERQSEKGLPLELPTQPVPPAEPITTLQLTRQPPAEPVTTQPDTPLSTILDPNHPDHAPDLAIAVKLWLELYGRDEKTKHSHSHGADLFLQKQQMQSTAKERVKEITSPMKNWNKQRRRAFDEAQK